MQKGDIILVSFPFTDLSGIKVRPALLLHIDRKRDDCIVAFISSKSEPKKHIYHIPVKTNATNGLKVDSTICVNKIATLEHKIILGRIGFIDQSVLSDVDTRLKKILSL